MANDAIRTSTNEGTLLDTSVARTSSTPHEIPDNPITEQRGLSTSPSGRLMSESTQSAGNRKLDDNNLQKTSGKKLRIIQPEPTNGSSTLQLQISALFDIVRVLVDNAMNKLADEIIEHPQQFRKRVHCAPNVAFQRVINDLTSETAETIKWRNLTKSIFDEYNAVNDGNRFSKAPELREIREIWNHLQEVLLSNAAHDNDTPVR